MLLKSSRDMEEITTGTLVYHGTYQGPIAYFSLESVINSFDDIRVVVVGVNVLNYFSKDGEDRFKKRQADGVLHHIVLGDEILIGEEARRTITDLLEPEAVLGL